MLEWIFLLLVREYRRIKICCAYTLRVLASWAQLDSHEDIMRHAFNAEGADMYYALRSYDVMEKLSKEESVHSHIGLIQHSVIIVVV